MKKCYFFINSLICLILLFFSCFVFANESHTNNAEKNVDLAKAPAQFILLEKLNSGEIASYTYIDRTSIKLHPYNKLIRTYKRIINFNSPLMIDINGEQKPYRSIVSHEYANCDKKEYAEGLIQDYENDFGSGTLQSENDKPKRWKSTAPNSKDRNGLIIICSLPLN